MFFSLTLKFACKPCLDNFTARDCTHLELMEEGLVVGIEERANDKPCMGVSILKSAKIDPIMNPKCSITSDYMFQCDKKCCSSITISSVYLVFKSLELQSHNHTFLHPKRLLSPWDYPFDYQFYDQDDEESDNESIFDTDCTHENKLKPVVPPRHGHSEPNSYIRMLRDIYESYEPYQGCPFRL